MITGFVFLAAIAAPPPPQHLPGTVATTDYPPTALERNEQGAVYVQMIVNPEGRVDSCSILLSSGYNDLDDATCRLVTSRARFSPAQGDNGEPIYGTYRHLITWRIYGSSVRLPTVPPDFDLTINQAPDGVRLPLQFTLFYRVKADGARSHCQLTSDPKAAPQVLVDLACNAVMQSPPEIIRNHNNEPVDASDCVTVRFSMDKTSH